jgi:outer membrane protein assembly factor BamB
MTRLNGLFLAFLIAIPAAHADDWPHWMGPKRDNVWREEGILEKFPEGGPKKLWSLPLAGGYSGPAVVGDKVFITDYLTKDKVEEGNWDLKEMSGIERVFCVNAKTGQQIWKHEYPVKYKISYPAGPRCTPAVDGDMVYTLGAMGDLIAFKTETGKIIWQKQLKDEFNAKIAIWGYAAHPLIDGKKLITLAGGDGSHIVAFDKNTGELLWKSQTAIESDDVGYAPPSIIEFGGKRQLLMAGPKALKSLDPETGKLYWSQKYTADNGSIIMTPVLAGEFLYVGGWKNKNLLVKLEKDKPGATTEWKDKKNMGIGALNVQPMLVDGTLYGFDHEGLLMACELPSGKRLWETDAVIGAAKNSDTAFFVRNGDRFFFFTEKGDLVIAKLSPEKYEEIDRAKAIIEPTNVAFGRKVVWCAPAFAGKKMYVRNDKELASFDMAK